MTTGLLSFSVIAIIIISVVVLLIFNLAIVCICIYLKYKQSSRSSDGKRDDDQSSQPTQPVYETIKESTLEVTKNTAYIPMHSTSL